MSHAHRTEIRSWALHYRSDKSLKELAAMSNPTIRGWITCGRLTGPQLFKGQSNLGRRRDANGSKRVE
jgi:hypothetical protein